MLKDFKERMRDRYYALVEWWRMFKLESEWRARGHPMPGLAAVEEMNHRIALEKFREYASDVYLADQTLTLTQIKRDYYSWVTPDTFMDNPAARESLETEMAAVAVMTDCFIGQARAIYEAEFQRDLRENIATVKAMRKHRPSYEVRARRGWC